MMLKPKYVAVNDLTGVQIKIFRTRWFAELWYRKPIKMLGANFTKTDFVSIYEVGKS